MELIPFTLLVITWAALLVVSPSFLSPENLSDMFAFIPELGIVALGMTMLLVTGEFDLSVGAVFGISPLVTFSLVNHLGVPIELAVAASLLASAVVGIVNGLFVTKVGISSFLVTLGVGLVVRGFGLFVSSGFPEPVTLAPDSWLSTVTIATIPVGPFTVHAGLIWFVAIAVALNIALRRMRIGNWMMATGGNLKAARARGIGTDRVKVTTFVLCALLAGLAGTISAIRVSLAYPVAGTGYELEVIAMCVIGGTSLFGGRGTIVGTVVGVILLRSIRNGLIVIGVPGLAYSMFVGLIILAAMSLQALIERRSREVA